MFELVLILCDAWLMLILDLPDGHAEAVVGVGGNSRLGDRTGSIVVVND